MKKTSLGFTLIELLVVIAILGTLSALLVPNFMSARERARDAQRKADLAQIQRALELYKADQTLPNYPSDATFLSKPGYCWSSSGVASTCPSGVNIYMSKVPSDPSSGASYSYTPTTSGSNTLQYTLCACLENKADTSGSPGNCSGSLSCSSGVMYSLSAQ